MGGDLVCGHVLGEEQVAGQGHRPVGEVLNGCLAEGLMDDAGDLVTRHWHKVPGW